MTNTEKLKHFMSPYYQTEDDVPLLNDYLLLYSYPECAAAALWEELIGSVGLLRRGKLAVDTGAEKFKYASPDTVQKACKSSAELYKQRCNDIRGIGSCAIRISKSSVGGATELDYKGGLS